MAALWGRVGALSGAAAVAAAAYGAHGMRRSDRDEYQKELYEIANRFHLLHSLALLAVPHCRRPHLAGSLLFGGLGLFCAPLYRQGLTGDPAGAAAAPLGGSLLILGWAAMALRRPMGAAAAASLLLIGRDDTLRVTSRLLLGDSQWRAAFTAPRF